MCSKNIKIKENERKYFVIFIFENQRVIYFCFQIISYDYTRLGYLKPSVTIVNRGFFILQGNNKGILVFFYSF